MDVTLRSDMTVELIQHAGSDAMVVHAARVSTRGACTVDDMEHDVKMSKSAPGLINFLMRNRHGTPFEHGEMTFRVEAPIFVFREWHRHRVGWSYNEESGRYKQLAPVFWIPSSSRNLVQVGKPGDYKYVSGTYDQWEGEIQADVAVYQMAYDLYEESLSRGIAREVARCKLPLAIYTSMYATCNPRSLMHFLSLRTSQPHSSYPSTPQAEIEECARKMEEFFSELYPVTQQAFNDYGRVCP